MTTGTPQKILVIDDDPFLRNFVVAVLQHAGFETREADSAVAGIAAALSDSPDLIILDYAMPNNDGMEVLKGLLQVHDSSSTPVIVLSAWQSDQVKAKAVALGASWLDKPVSGPDLVEVVKARLAP